jgi:hypothetical protein
MEKKIVPSQVKDNSFGLHASEFHKESWSQATTRSYWRRMLMETIEIDSEFSGEFIIYFDGDERDSI